MYYYLKRQIPYNIILMKETELLFFKLSINSKIPIKNEKFSDKRNLKKINEINTRFYNVGLALMRKTKA